MKRILIIGATGNVRREVVSQLLATDVEVRAMTRKPESAPFSGTSPHQTPHPLFQQPNPLAALHAELERLITRGAAGVALFRWRPSTSFFRHGLPPSDSRH